MPSPGEENTHGERDHQHVIATCPEEIDFDLPKDSASQVQSGDNVEEV